MAYVYILFDTRKFGPFQYQDLIFDHEPFYIGKGNNNRAHEHINKKSVKISNKHKSEIIDLIFLENLFPKVLIYKNKLTNEEAESLEIELIKKIGRIDLNLGPLTNLTSGGQKGPIGAIRSTETRNKISKRLIGKSSPKSKYIKSDNYKPSTLNRRLSVEEKLQISNAVTGSKNPNSLLTEEKVKEIKLSLINGNSIRILSTKFNVSIPTISAIKHNRTWKHV